MTTINTCPECKQRFATASPRHIHCSRACVHERARRLVREARRERVIAQTEGMLVISTEPRVPNRARAALRETREAIARQLAEGRRLQRITHTEIQ